MWLGGATGGTQILKASPSYTPMPINAVIFMCYPVSCNMVLVGPIAECSFRVMPFSLKNGIVIRP